MNRVFIFFFFSFAVHLALGLALISKTNILNSLSPSASSPAKLNFEPPAPKFEGNTPFTELNKKKDTSKKQAPLAPSISPPSSVLKQKPLSQKKPKEAKKSQATKKPSPSPSSKKIKSSLPSIKKPPKQNKTSPLSSKAKETKENKIIDDENLKNPPSPYKEEDEEKKPPSPGEEENPLKDPVLQDESSLPKTIVEGTPPPLPIILIEKPKDLKPNSLSHFTELRELEGNPKITYPKQAELLRLEGTVVVYFYVNKAGFVEKIHVRKSSGYNILDNAAIKALSRYLYHPGQETWVQQPVQFSLKKPSQS